MEKQVKELSWFLNFISLDLDSLSIGDITKWTAETILKTTPHQLSNVELGKKIGAWLETDSLELCQVSIEVTLDKITKGEASTLFDNFKTDGVTTVIFGVDQDLTFQTFLQGADVTETIVLRFVQILQRIPPAVIKKCKECSSYYIHMTKKFVPSKKKRMFCTNRCAAKYGARRYRREKK
jgi:hypothetical protein